MSYYYKKNDKYRQKLKICKKNYAGKRCPPNQLNIKLITKNNKNLRLHFLKVTKLVNQMTPMFVMLLKENRNQQKRGQIRKNHENWFYENGLFQEENPFEENKTVMKSSLSFNR